MIDVIIPTYKPNDYFFECLESIQNQTISFDNFKVTIVLNGDKEPFFSNIESIMSGFSFDYALIYSSKKGVSNARNLGLDTTNNPYVLFLDDDDILTQNYLEKALLITEPNSIVVSNTLSFIDNVSKISKDYLSFDKIFQSKNIVKYRKYLSNSCCKLIPRNIIGNHRFDPHIFRGEDALFMFSLSHKIMNIVSTDPDVIYFRRLRPLSASRKKYSFFREIMIGLQQQARYTSLYLKNLKGYSFLLYMTRILAILKVMLIKLKGQR